MKNVIQYLAGLSFVLLLSNCGKNEEWYTVHLNEPFVADKGYNYTCHTDNGDVIVVKFTDIEDRRVYGTGCQVSMGGYANVEVSIKVNKKSYSKTYVWRGCDGFAEHPITLPTLPRIEIGDYEVIMMKLYPLTETREYPPSSKNNYSVKLAILK